ncbi:hypothetical protein BOTBODRAFT_27893 [Botryobasidium botryosum FD-172 SS1]|uniref:Uncharacterized protein n=1 Tax=Botryobasidium botryosum (strain FD-172 SS1) TaxID=930990 RepID=A0A067N5D3_BOTB1|nr:hypothetical protein BOTBODRAFT_27893 [Botryobasidium botryosum FD-172 SS1]
MLLRGHMLNSAIEPAMIHPIEDLSRNTSTLPTTFASLSIDPAVNEQTKTYISPRAPGSTIPADIPGLVKAMRKLGKGSLLGARSVPKRGSNRDTGTSTCDGTSKGKPKAKILTKQTSKGIRKLWLKEMGWVDMGMIKKAKVARAIEIKKKRKGRDISQGKDICESAQYAYS